MVAPLWLSSSNHGPWRLHARHSDLPLAGESPTSSSTRYAVPHPQAPAVPAPDHPRSSGSRSSPRCTSPSLAPPALKQSMPASSITPLGSALSQPLLSLRPGRDRRSPLSASLRLA
ncbi:hypothetical protein ZWY2020_057175 [Hordeum vulgare]|nr:hypothetical protein ZWY2020_057175 [Hordeum vulgare]